MGPELLPAVILMADDDEDDIVLARDAFERGKIINDFRVVEDGQELLDYLKHRGAYSDPASAPLPDIILLDLNMPKIDGREALKEIKADPRFRHIQIVIFTTSESRKDVLDTYCNGASSYITKPVTFEAMCELVQKLSEYWFQIVRLPGHIGCES
jgi:CheY-like chemotaxis protein